MNRNNIVAIIPARAGSKGIPNKNVRIIGGHPLVYYSIRNALASKYINSVVVTTDSFEVRLIAEKMGAICKWRSRELCGDEITLDAVVADAIPEGEWDYVITMQPTSPTLSVGTLDAAIEYTIARNLDTCISVLNTPHLSWTEQGGKKVPKYAKRLNRQYLPPDYMETGAFVISKGSIVTPQTRIGKNVDVYELSSKEAIDIDNFEELYSAKAVLSLPRKVGIYVNGNNNRGLGHIYRALEMADEFMVKPDIYYDLNQTSRQIFGSTTHNLIAVDGIAELFSICKEKQYDVFCNDILATSIDYMIGLRSVLPNAKLVNFEDDGEGATKANVVFNALLENSEYHHIKTGSQYYICGKSFLFYSPIKVNMYVRRVLIAFGGADPQNYTDRLLNIIVKQEYAQFHFVVVLGRAKNNVELLMKYNEYENIEVFHDVKNMPELMSSCDVAITSRGRTCYELALLGIPSIAMAQNAREEKHGFVCNENGFSYIGLNPSDIIVEESLRELLQSSKETRQQLQKLQLKNELKRGRERVMNIINSL